MGEREIKVRGKKVKVERKENSSPGPFLNRSGLHAGMKAQEGVWRREDRWKDLIR